jgi:hypothetical protein
MLLEVGIESQHFSIVFKPRRLYSWNVVVLRWTSLFLVGEVVEGFGHLIDEVLIDLLFIVLSLLLLGAIDEIELLGFMIVLLIRIMEDMTWQEGDFLWNVCLHPEVIFFINKRAINIH